MMMNILKVILLSMVPLVEQRGAIPLGIIGYHLNPFLVFSASLLGSFLPAPIVYLSFNKIFEVMKKFKQLDWFTKFVEKKVQNGSKKLEKYKEVGLITFVGIPLPTTGLWTGTAIAAFMGLDFKKSMWCVFLGGVISAVIITVVSVIAPAVLGLHV